MRKVIKEKTVYFYDDNNEEIMYIDHSTDECIWFFNSEQKVSINEDSELYELLSDFMSGSYQFQNDELKNHKDDTTLTWYSDCYYNPDDEFSLASVSCLHIKMEEGTISIWPTKKLDEMIERKHKSYGICFSPAGNGKYSKNISTGSFLQDDFVTKVYQRLLERNKVYKKI